jgi:hypothetical protein
MENKRIAQRRAVVYLEEDKYYQLAAKLKRQGRSVSSWFREQVANELRQPKKSQNISELAPTAINHSISKL